MNSATSVNVSPLALSSRLQGGDFVENSSVGNVPGARVKKRSNLWDFFSKKIEWNRNVAIERGIQTGMNLRSSVASQRSMVRGLFFTDSKVEEVYRDWMIEENRSFAIMGALVMLVAPSLYIPSFAHNVFPVTGERSRADRGLDGARYLLTIVSILAMVGFSTPLVLKRFRMSHALQERALFGISAVQMWGFFTIFAFTQPLNYVHLLSTGCMLFSIPNLLFFHLRYGAAMLSNAFPMFALCLCELFNLIFRYAVRDDYDGRPNIVKGCITFFAHAVSTVLIILYIRSRDFSSRRNFLVLVNLHRERLRSQELILQMLPHEAAKNFLGVGESFGKRVGGLIIGVARKCCKVSIHILRCVHHGVADPSRCFEFGICRSSCLWRGWTWSS